MTPDRISCQTCGERVELPAGYDRAKIRCPMCGYYVPVPADLRNRPPAVEPAADAGEPDPPPERSLFAPDDAPPPPPDRAKAKKGKKPKRPPMLAGTTDDDGRPYGVPADDHKPCPDCGGRIHADATFCTKCGYNLETRERTRREEFQPVDKSWEARWPLQLRLQIFAGCLGLNVLLVALSMAFGGGVIQGLFIFALQSALQAFVIGTYETIRVTRTSKGVATLTKSWRVGFFPLVPYKIQWRASAKLNVVGMHEVGGAEIMTLMYLFFCTAILPAIVFWFFAVRPERFAVARCDIYGTTDELLFTTTDRDVAVEIARTIGDCTGLIYKPHVRTP